MNLLIRAHIFQRPVILGVALGVLALSAGCSELHTAVDAILGKQPLMMAARSEAPQTLVPGAMRTPSTSQPITEEAARPPQPRVDVEPPKTVAQAQPQAPAPPKPPAVAPRAQLQPPAAPAPPEGAPQAQPRPTTEANNQLALEGKRRTPGQASPTAPPSGPPVEAPKTEFKVERDPFKPPSEVQVRTDYLPSTPLARFDYSQLKLVGVIQMAEGQIKGMVEDPDGRGYYVQPGMQIGDGPNMATVTQITNRGVMLRIHKTNRDVAIPLFGERAETERL